MSEINNGGPAFPVTGEGATGTRVHSKGMSLRDWFAGQALIGMMGAMRPYSDRAEQCAADAYKQADAMLAARAKAEGR